MIFDNLIFFSLTIPEPIEMTDSPVTFDMKILENSSVFDFDGQLESIAPSARSIPTARRGRKHLEFSKIFMSKVTGLSVISMGSGIHIFRLLGHLPAGPQDRRSCSVSLHGLRGVGVEGGVQAVGS